LRLLAEQLMIPRLVLLLIVVIMGSVFRNVETIKFQL